MTEAVAAYLAAVRTSLPPGLGARRTARILREIEEHILEGWGEERTRGAPPEEALHQVLARCGPPDVIALGFQPVVDVRRVRIGRNVLVASLCLCFLIVGISLLRYPTVAGTSGAAVGYLLLLAAILGLFGWVGLDATRTSSPVVARVLWRGLAAGLVTSVVLFATMAISDLALTVLWGSAHLSSSALLTIDHRIQELALGGPAVVGVLLTTSAGASAAAQTGRIATGAQVGLWSGMLSALGLLLASLAVSNALADVLARTEWPHDPTCAVSHASTLAACEVGDMLGGAASLLLLLPLVWIGLGILGGLVGRASAARIRARQPSLGFAPSMLAVPVALSADVPTVQGAGIRSLVLFSIALLATFVIGLLAHLW